jgi:hypothetical protein
MLRAAAGYQAPAPANTDPQFNYVSLLLHGDGTNGAQNNTFLDSSSNNFTITRNGNPTQGSLSPYGNLWSNFFSSTTGYLTVAGGMPSGTGTAFTMECWIYITNLSDYNAITRGDVSPRLDWGVDTSGSLKLDSVTVGNICSSAANTIQTNVWYHVVVTRSTGNVYKLWVNGTNVATSSALGTSFSANTTIGYSSYSSSHYFKGYISNFRVVTSEVYTSAFTPPTAPLTAISGTSLLTCQSNRFIDNSANNFTITRNGDVRVTKEAPFLPTAAYSTSVIGGSAYFDGTGDWLTVPSNSAFDQTGDFTFETWVRVDATVTGTFSNFGNVFSQETPNIFKFGFNKSRQFVVLEAGAGSPALTSTTTFAIGVWYHVAVVRSGMSTNNLKLYVNGAQEAQTTKTNSVASANTTFIGREAWSGDPGTLTGALSDLRYVKGTAVYTSNFTPPTAPLTAITNTSLLLNFTNAGIFDNAAENVLETVGNAQISTSVKKYGTGSLAFDGTGDWLLVPDNTNLQLGTGNFTVEAWVYLSATGSARGLVGKGTSTTGWLLSTNSSDQIVFTHGTTTLTSSSALSANTWTHVAVVREGTGTNQTKIYIGGSNVATGTVSTDFNQTSVMYVGADRTGGSALNGYIDDLRITKGYARYTANFTPPTAAFPDQ